MYSQVPFIGSILKLSKLKTLEKNFEREEGNFKIRLNLIRLLTLNFTSFFEHGRCQYKKWDIGPSNKVKCRNSKRMR